MAVPYTLSLIKHTACSLSCLVAQMRRVRRHAEKWRQFPVAKRPLPFSHIAQKRAEDGKEFQNFTTVIQGYEVGSRPNSLFGVPHKNVVANQKGHPFDVIGGLPKVRASIPTFRPTCHRGFLLLSSCSTLTIHACFHSVWFDKLDFFLCDQSN